ncbi:zinc finger, C3HC4 type [Ancylostoma caninum]|uniref:E3 ubiquitin-protein ligase n=1 Tax=Ancylostoma caninum TaxID=29170 RepID=A0A368G122_ANCCA|nr:zinc finger, C3HC4 type [Ancylostoma caninum]
MARGCTSVAIPGLGCGLIGNSIHASCLKACEVLHQTASVSLGSIQMIVFIDMKEKVAQQFIAQMEAEFGVVDSAEAINRPGNSVEHFSKPPTCVQQDDCVICLCPLSELGEVSELPCKHQLHTSCLKEYLKSANAKKRCPVCLRYFELPLGDQPSEARMFINKLSHIKLPGITFLLTGVVDSAEAINRPGNSVEHFSKPPTCVQQDDCVICLCPLSEPGEVSELPCKHQLHTSCLKEYLKSANAKKRCPVCLRYFELPLGDQPSEARMFINKLSHIKLPGHEDSDFVYEIIYSVPDGIQEASHIRPGKPFTGTHRRAFVPGTREGTKVLRLLKFAFDRRLIFTVGDSITTGARNTVVWNNIHHKTSIGGGPLKYGYPDPDYLNRVKDDLAAMGITEDMLPEEMEI